ncbi:MAG: Calx-beta domain-containing protein [Panacagrimonas sp.]
MNQPGPRISSGPCLNPIAAALALGLFGMQAGPASAATITVTTTAQTSAVACTLSDAIRAANTDTAVGSCLAGDAGLDILVLPARSVFSFTTPEGGAYNGLPFFTSEIVIQGNGSTIRRHPAAPTAFRVVAVGSGGKLTLQSTTISGGVADDSEGGGINIGGGATLALVDSTVSGNGANYGAGLFNSGGIVTLTRSTVSGNNASDFGGGLYNTGTATLTDSTVSGNGAFYGGGLLNKGTLTLTHSTVSGNNASHGGALSNLSGTTSLSRSLIAGNGVGSGPEVNRTGGTVIANDLNLFGHSGLTNAQAFYGFTPGVTDLTATSNGNTPTALASILGPLAFNGGLTQTHALVTGSPALDAYPPDGGGACAVTTDQRGVLRPRFGDCDIGAFEFAALDLGDAPASYGTLLADNGAVHVFPAGPGLGFVKDSESDGQPSAAADGDDNDTDDEASVTTPLSFTIGQTGVSIPVDTNGVGFLSAWLDVNRDGDFDDAADAQTLDAPLNSAFSLAITVPSTASAGTSYLRLRVCSTVGNCNTPRGLATDGEVEDFPVTLVMPLTLSISDASVTEGNSGTANLVFTVSLSVASASPVTVNYATADGTAKLSDLDYPAAVGGSLSFTPGQTSQTITVPVKGDTKFEPNETLFVNLSGATGASISDGQGVGSITNDDAQPTLRFTGDNRTVSEGVGMVTVMVELSNPSQESISASLIATLLGASTADFSGLPASVTFAPGIISKSYSFSINDDALDEADEILTLNLGLLGLPDANVGLPDAINVTIQDNDNPPTVSLSAAPASINEAAGVSTVTATLSAASGLPVTVNLGFAGTAGAGDYVSNGSVIPIAAGSTIGTVTVTASQDLIDEANETVIASITSASNATPAGGSATVTILDDDAPPTVSFSPAAQSVSEATASLAVNVVLSAPSGLPITVPLNFAGTASNPADYSPSTTSLSIPAGSPGGSFSLSIVNDTLFESPNETVILGLGSLTNASTGSQNSQTVTILDNDVTALSSLTLAPATASKLTLTQHCVVATAKDSVGTALPNLGLSFQVTGVNPGAGTVNTSTAGTAQYCYTGTNGGTDSIKVSFTGSLGLKQATSTVTFNKRNTGLKVEPVPAVTVRQNGQIRILISPRATLKDANGNVPVAGKSISFKAGTTTLCTATTNAQGVATCNVNLLNTLVGVLSLGYTGTYAGDTAYNPSSGNGGILGLKLF